jgi:hypothetical protein
MKTLVIRIDLNSDVYTLEKQVVDECDVRWDAGYRLAATFVSGDQMVLIFQPKA